MNKKVRFKDNLTDYLGFALHTVQTRMHR